MKRDHDPTDLLQLSGLVIECIVGVYPIERDTPQPLEVELTLQFDARPATRGGGLRKSVDYARLSAEVRFLLESSRFFLLETAADAIASYVLAPATPDRPQAFIDAVTVRLTKPRALGGARATLEVHRTAKEMRYAHETKPFGSVDVIAETKECGIYRLRIAPGRAIPTHVHRVMDEREMVLGAGLHLQGRPVLPGTVLTWPKDVPHRYDNHTSVEQSVLCVDRPRFIPDDEIEVDDAVNPVSGESYYPAGDHQSLLD